MHLGKWLFEPLLEFFARREDFRKQEVKKSPKLGQVVLQRCTCQQKSMLRAILLAKGACKFRLGVPDAMALIDDNVLPLKLAESGLVV